MPALLSRLRLAVVSVASRCRQTLQGNRHWRRGLLGVAAFLVLLGLFGFFAAPPLLHRELEKALSEALHRPVTVGAIHVNPYALSLEIDGLSVADKAGGELLGVDRLYANLEALSLWHGGVVLRELAVEGPRLALARGQDGRYNVSDLIDEWLAKPASPPTLFSLNNIHLSGGRFSFADGPAHSKHEIGDIALSVPFISNLPYQTDIFVEPAFSATIDGAPFVLKGKSKPFAASKESELVIDIDRFDIARLAPYLPPSLPVHLAGGRLNGDIHLTFRQGEREISTLLLSGHLALADLALRGAAGQELLKGKRIDAEIAALDVPGHRLDLKSLTIEAPELRLSRDAEGRLVGLGAPSGAASSPAASGKKSAPWRIVVGNFKLADGSLLLRDPSLGAKPLENRIDGLNLAVHKFDSAIGKTELATSMRINKGGSLSLRGPLSLSPLALDLNGEWQNLQLLPWQPYVAARLNARLIRGQLSGKGRVQLADSANGFSVGFSGEATLGDLSAVDLNGINLVSWKSLYFGAIDAKLVPSQPLALSVGEVALADFQARADVAPDGKLNLAQLLRPAAADAKATAQPPAASSPSPSISIGKVTLQGGRIAFTDRFIKPGYSARLSEVGGRIGSLTPKSGSAADFELRGKVDNSAPLLVSGKVNPLSAPPFLDLKATVKGFELSPLSPYAGKFAGYGISKGKLSLDVAYHLENNQLQANNHLFLDQLTFGERVDSPQATSLPVQLLVSLLKNRRGEIDLDLPISGSLEDPQFSLGGVIFKVIVNLLEKAVTSPFALIASLFGGDEELSFIDYAPGHATLSPAALKRLETLAKALTERPALSLEISGRADPEQDSEGLKQARLERKVRAQKIAERTRAGVASGDDTKVSAEEYPALLKRAYDEEKFPKPRNLIGMAKSLPVAEMEKLMLSHIVIADNDMQMLANRRAQAARDWLVEQGKVDAARVFLVAPKVQVGAKGDAAGLRAEFSLK
jgi:uncharacterized protein involved in outer membrane biogenesis